MGSNLINVSLSRTGRVRYAQMTQWGSFKHGRLSGGKSKIFVLLVILLGDFFLFEPAEYVIKDKPMK